LALLKPDNTAVLPHFLGSNTLQYRQLINVLERAIRLTVLDDTMRFRKTRAR